MGSPEPVEDQTEPVSFHNSGAHEGCSCPKSLGRFGFLPPVYRDEALQLLKLAGPVLISQLMVFMVSTISLAFCGHLGKTELAGVSLATAVVNITGISVGTGLSSACDTLMSQTYGSSNLKRVGVILQRGFLILLLACFPCWAVLINTEPLLLAFRQSPEVASLAQLYVKIFMPAIPAAFVYQLLGKYLQNQGIMWPQVITGAIGNAFNVIINYIFLYPLEWGVPGSAAANSISQYLLPLFLYFYICWRGLHKNTWGGWSLDCLQEWGLFIRLAIPSMLMTCLAWWIFEIGGFLAGVISEVELGAQSIVYQLCTVAYMCPLGFSVAASVRVGNALGAGDVKQAKLSCKVPIICASKNRSLQDIIHRVRDVMIIYGFTHVCEATAGVAAGVLRGTGNQMIGAMCNFVCIYFIGFPIGASLMFAANIGIVGLWTGLTISLLLQSVFFLVFLWRLDWEKASEEALVRAGVRVKEEYQKHLGPNQNQDQITTVEAGPRLQGAGQKDFTTTTVGALLSVRQLVLRRGLALLIMAVILVVGILTSRFLLRLLK
ncbi:multidrug and toxin extrusion protein 1-like [Pholidichthys leucotaenia]